MKQRLSKSESIRQTSASGIRYEGASRNQGINPYQQAKPYTPPGLEELGIYIVNQGDSPESISNRLGISIWDLAAYNWENYTTIDEMQIKATNGAKLAYFSYSSENSSYQDYWVHGKGTLWKMDPGDLVLTRPLSEIRHKLETSFLMEMYEKWQNTNDQAQRDALTSQISPMVENYDEAVEFEEAIGMLRVLFGRMGRQDFNPPRINPPKKPK